MRTAHVQRRIAPQWRLLGELYCHSETVERIIPAMVILNDARAKDSTPDSCELYFEDLGLRREKPGDPS